MPGKKENGKGGGFVRDAAGKAVRATLGTIVPVTVFKRVSSSGKAGFSGQVLDTSTGQKYQVIMAVEIAS